MRVRLKAGARADLLAIRDWGVDRWGSARTRDFLEGLIRAIERLADYPHLGRSRDVFLPGLRSISHAGYIIFYVSDEDGPVVLAVLHERRNHGALDFAERSNESER